MAALAKPLKVKNSPLMWALIAADSLAVLAIAYPSFLEQAAIPLKVGHLSLASLGPAAILLISSLLPPNAKDVLVFWRLCDVLPGHRAFSKYALVDPRIDLEVLKKNAGRFPDAPRDQNTLWYRLYKKVETEPAVTLSHGNFLLFRDLAAVSILLTIVVPLVLFVLQAQGHAIFFSFCLFGAQYAVTAIAAKNHGVRFVTNVLALHSSKRRA